MADIAKYMDVDIGNIAKIFGIEKANIGKVVKANIPASVGDRGVWSGGGCLTIYKYY